MAVVSEEFGRESLNNYMEHNKIIDKAEVCVREIYEKYPREVFTYHNLGHVEQVVKAAGQIASHYQLNDQDFRAVLIAAWFHDVGYLFMDCYDDHEIKSAEFATSFLVDNQEDSILIEKVCECILATKIFCEPTSLISKIVADADLFHLGTIDFRKTNKMMWVEIKRCFGKKIPTDEWYKKALYLLEKHQFHTEYCREHLQEGKQENIDFLKEWLKKNILE